MSAKVSTFRSEVLEKIEKFLLEEDYEVLRVPLTDNSSSNAFRLALPTLDEDSNEATICIACAATKKKRDGTDFDPYDENQRYLENCELVKQRKERAKANREKKNKKKKIGNGENPVED